MNVFLFCWGFFGILNFFPQLTHYFPNTTDSKDHASHCPLVSPLPYICIVDIVSVSRTSILFYLFIINLFIYFWLRWVFVAVHGLSLVTVSGGYSLLWCAGFSLWWLLLLRSTGSRRTGFSSCGPRVQ